MTGQESRAVGSNFNLVRLKNEKFLGSFYGGRVCSPRKFLKIEVSDWLSDAFLAMLDHATESEEQCICPKHFVNFLHEPTT